jgi:hypothetical protein
VFRFTLNHVTVTITSAPDIASKRHPLLVLVNVR